MGRQINVGDLTESLRTSTTLQYVQHMCPDNTPPRNEFIVDFSIEGC